ncbi:RNA 2',3'-cyclic phosphodiesterase [Candidatus Micrarchaeota archaeon]|nr:RNA 2',3'-cyclic phosphodiesterase [Candidatus Micrarchaeota archaeon]
MRLFIAVPVPQDIRENVAALGKEIAQEGVVPVKPASMHMTLKFIGEVDEAKLGGMKERLGEVSFKDFDCALKGVGVFPNEQYIKVVWAGAESGGALEALAKAIIEAMRGYDGHDERFSAHLTIARVKRKVDLKAFLEKHKDDSFGSFTVSSFHLIQSVLKPEGPEYSVLACFEAEK